MTNQHPQRDRTAPSTLLTPAEVAQMFRVDPKTVTRWAKQGKLPFIFTIGGHRRYARADVDRLVNAWRNGGSRG